MFNARNMSSSAAGIGMISSRTVRNSPNVKMRSARLSSVEIGLEAVALMD